MAFTLRTVVREKSGKVGVVIERRPLRAVTLNEAKREVDRGSWVRDGIELNGFEIFDDEGAYRGPTLIRREKRLYSVDLEPRGRLLWKGPKPKPWRGSG